MQVYSDRSILWYDIMHSWITYFTYHSSEVGFSTCLLFAQSIWPSLCSLRSGTYWFQRLVTLHFVFCCFLILLLVIYFSWRLLCSFLYWAALITMKGIYKTAYFLALFLLTRSYGKTCPLREDLISVSIILFIN